MTDDLLNPAASSPLRAGLALLPSRHWAAVIHVGAGSGTALALHRGLQADRLWLVEGDAEQAQSLLRAEGLPARATVRPVVVAARGGDLLWHRYSVPSLNGPLEADAWRALYPRLALLHTQARQSTPIEKEVSDFLAESGGAEPLLMVLDVPGQESSLLDALPDSMLQRFDAVVVRCCESPASPEWCSARDTCARLAQAGFEVTGRDDDPIWPVFALTLDRERLRLLRQAERLRALEQQVQADGARLASLQAALVESERQTQLVREQAETFRRETETRLLAAAQSGEASQQALRASEDRQTSLLVRIQSLEGDLSAERDRSSRADQLVSERDALAKDKAALVQERDTAVQHAQELQTRVDALGQELKQRTAERDHAGSERAKFLAERDALAKEKATLTQEHDTAVQHAQELQTRVDTLGQELKQRTAERDHTSNERAKFLAERDALAKDKATLTQERDSVSGERQKAAAERDNLAKEKALLVQARDEQTKAARDARQRVSTLEAELAELGARHGLLREELVKAEAQIELIADLLLREPRG